jgi:hypothetical protein
MFRTVRWLLVGLLAVQLLIVPWRVVGQTQYAPIFAPPPTASGGFGGSGPAATIDAGRLLVQLAVTGGLLLLWLRVAKPEE